MIEIRQQRFDPYHELASYQKNLPVAANGASVVFIGSLRDFNDGDAVQAMELEYYPGMTEKVLVNLSSEAVSRWQLNDLVLLHRVGLIQLGEPIVLVAVWSPHRADAFAACRYLIDTLKTTAPFWKKETIATGARWVETNTH